MKGLREESSGTPGGGGFFPCTIFFPLQRICSNFFISIENCLLAFTSCRDFLPTPTPFLSNQPTFPMVRRYKWMFLKTLKCAINLTNKCDRAVSSSEGATLTEYLGSIFSQTPKLQIGYPPPPKIQSYVSPYTRTKKTRGRRKVSITIPTTDSSRRFSFEQDCHLVLGLLTRC